jgi:hypothetical protein
MNKKLRTIIQYLFFLGLGIFFAWLSLKNLDKEKTEQIKTAFRNARHWLIVPVFALLILGHFVRALRWRLLIESLGYQSSKANTFFAVMIGYLVNQGVPRLGEVMKCTVLARYEKIPADKLIGTIILERMIDALTLLLVFGITIAIQPDLYSRLMETFFNISDTTEKKGLSSWVITLLLVAALVLLIGLWMLVKKKTLRDVRVTFIRIGKSIVQGVSAIQHLRKRKLFIFLTILLWSIYLMGGYIGFMAFEETRQYGIKEAFAILSAGSIGMIAAPGGIGAYAYLIERTMQLYGLNSTIALAFGWILWLAQTLVTLVGGLFSFLAIPWYNKRKISEDSLL